MVFLDTTNAPRLPATDPTRERVIAALRASGGESTCGAIAKVLGVHSSTVLNAITKLCAQGLAERVPPMHKPARFRLTEP